MTNQITLNGNTRIATYGYDDLNRLTSVDHGDGKLRGISSTTWAAGYKGTTAPVPSMRPMNPAECEIFMDRLEVLLQLARNLVECEDELKAIYTRRQAPEPLSPVDEAHEIEVHSQLGAIQRDLDRFLQDEQRSVNMARAHEHTSDPHGAGILPDREQRSVPDRGHNVQELRDRLRAVAAVLGHPSSELEVHFQRIDEMKRRRRSSG